MSTIEGYTTATSATQGDTLEFCISNSPDPGTSPDFTIDIFRVDKDYFAGTASPVFHGSGGAGSHPYPPMAYASGCDRPVGLAPRSAEIGPAACTWRSCAMATGPRLPSISS
jgi:hypothetical protein